jgi:hypothetical protein
MLSGFNTNYRHRGVLFHVQTEDSGRANPHVITHLFHGGNIIASEKRVYSDKMEAEDLESEVKNLMESQHKQMLKQLSRGEHDAAIAQRLGPEVFQEQTDSSDTMPPIAETPAPVDAPTQSNASSESVDPTESSRDRMVRAFGDSIVSEKPLDEVVLDYLVENARKRKRSAK